MVNNISNNPASISTGFADVAKRELAKREAQAVVPVKRLRAEENYVPAPETLSTLVKNAVSALKSGTVFDRGSILNLVI
jgi:hypothetical protein